MVEPRFSLYLPLARLASLAVCLLLHLTLRFNNVSVPFWIFVFFLMYGIVTCLLVTKRQELDLGTILWTGDTAFAMVLVIYSGGPHSPLIFLLYLFLASSFSLEPRIWCWVGGILLSVFSGIFFLVPPTDLYRPISFLQFLPYPVSFFLTSAGVWFFAPETKAPPDQPAREELLKELDKGQRISQKLVSIAEKNIQQYRKKTRELSSLYAVVTKISSSLDPRQIMEVILTKAREETGSGSAFLMLVEGDNLKVSHSQEISEETIQALYRKVSSPPFSLVLSESRPLRLKREDPAFTILLSAREQFRDALMVPLKEPTQARPFGILVVANSLAPEGLTSRHEHFLMAMASQAAVALENATLHQQIKKVHLDTIMRLSVAAEYRDEDTAEHLYRISNYSAIISRYLGLPPSNVEIIKYASPMHDIGKIGIPDAILMKPGQFTPEEFEEMKRHPLIGAKILANADSPLLMISAAIALTHHEKYDGTGYPRGLKEKEIPLEGRIVALADVFDALMSKRVYKEAVPLEEVLNHIKENAGKHFDPTVVDAFFKGLDEILVVDMESRRDEKHGASL